MERFLVDRYFSVLVLEKKNRSYSPVDMVSASVAPYLLVLRRCAYLFILVLELEFIDVYHDAYLPLRSVRD